ncbi:MAG: hypothetical protein WAV25_01310 [Minisyncoccia bacterium]
MRIGKFLVLYGLAIALAACGDNNPTAPREKSTVIVTANDIFHAPVVMFVGGKASVGIQSSIIGENRLDAADVLVVKVDSLITKLERTYNGSGLGTFYYNNVTKSTVDRFEVWELTAGMKTGTTWMKFHSTVDPTQRDSLQIIVFGVTNIKGQ